MTRQNILYILGGLDLGQNSGGAEMHAVKVARMIDRSKFQPIIYALWRYDTPNESKWRTKLEREEIPVYGLRIPGKNHFTDLSHHAAKLWQLAHHYQPLVMHSHTENADFINAVLHEFNRSNPISIRTVHIEERWKTHQILGTIIDKLVMPISVSAETAVSSSIVDSLNNRLLSRLTGKKAILINNGVDEGLFVRENVTKKSSSLGEQLPGSSPRICIIGRLAEQKGHIYLFKAMPDILESVPAHLLVIGTGPLDEELRAYASQLGISEFVHFMGSRNDIVKLFPQIKLLISPSVWEGFPTVIIEAMSQGVPVVASDVSGSRELVIDRETGYLVPSKNPPALAKAILECLQNNKLHETIIPNAYKHASKFTIQKSTSQYMQLYSNLSPPRKN